MIYAAVVLNIAILLPAEFRREKNRDFVKAVILALTKFILLFCAISLALFVVDAFSYFYVLLLEIIISAEYSCIVCLRKRPEKSISIDTASLWIPLLICCIALPLTAVKAGYFGTAQDEGVYQAEAITFVYDHTSLVSHFDEYEILESDDEREYYLDFLDDLGGYNRVGRTLSLENYSNKTAPLGIEDDTGGVYHGVHVFSALLGLWAKMFGFSNMPGVVTLIHLCAIFLFFFVLQNLEINRVIAALSTGLFAFSPLILWLSKTTYSESLVLLALCLYLYYLTLAEKTTTDVLSIGTATVGIMCTHIMFLVIYPAFWAVNIIEGAHRRDSRFLMNNVIASAGLTAVSYAFSVISMQYYFDNLNRLYIGTVITIDNVLWWIFAGAVVSAALSWPLSRLLCRLGKEKGTKILVNAGRIVIVASIVYAGLHFYRIGSGSAEQTIFNNVISDVWGSGKQALFHSSLWALLCFSGALAFPCTVISALKWKKYSDRTQTENTLLILYIWLVFAYSAVLKADVWYYFYYARYLGYVVPVVILYFAYTVSGVESKRLSKAVGVGIPVISLALMLVLDVPVAKYKDDTFVEWDTLQTIAEQVGSDDALIVSHSLQLKYALALDSLTGAGTFPVFEDLDAQEELLQKNYKNVYILCGDDEANELQASSEAKLTTAVSTDNTSSYNRLYFIDGFRFENYTETTGIMLYRCE